MDFSNLGKDRFLRRDPDQTDQTKDAIYTVNNPAPKRGDDTRLKIGQPKGSEEDDGAPNILTGTVITACFIQTSALPSRIELQGNDLTFFDDTTVLNGVVIGDTSRLIFTHGSAKQGEVITAGFILEKRASIYSSYDNVLSWFSPSYALQAHNYMFIGREGTGDQRNLSNLRLAINEDSNVPDSPADQAVLNGVFAVEYSLDAVEDAIQIRRLLPEQVGRFQEVLSLMDSQPLSSEDWAAFVELAIVKRQLLMRRFFFFIFLMRRQ